jgi:thiamine pyrophosphokinase
VSHVVVLVGGRMRPHPRLQKLVADAHAVVAADSGLHHAEALGLRVDLLVGDMDSVDARVLARYPRVPIEAHPRNKEVLDLELALDATERFAPTRISVIGGLAGRLDQTLANLAIVAARHRASLPMLLDDGVARTYPLISGETRTLGLAPRTLLSLQPLDAEVTLTIAGVRYPLERATLKRATGRGVSNLALGSVHIAVHHGSLLLVVPGGNDPTA